MRNLFTLVLCLFVLSGYSQTVVTGRIDSRQQLIQGAIILINGTNDRVVTDATGMFRVVIPDSMKVGTLTASYAGYADEHRAFRADTFNVIRMLHETPIKVSRKNRLEFYMRTAHRQIRKELRKVH